MPAAPATPRPPISAQTIPLFPLASTLFPEGRLPLQIFEVRYLDMIGKCIAEGSSFTIDVTIRRRDGMLRQMRLTADVEFEGGRPVRLYGTKQDVTDE